MAELVAVTMNAKAAVPDEMMYLRLPMATTLVGVSVTVFGRSGSPTGGFVAITEEVLDEICTVEFGPSTAWSGDWRSRHFGGNDTPVALPPCINLGAHLYVYGGVNPTMNIGLTLWLVV
jgi:hypothetical protein